MNPFQSLSEYEQFVYTLLPQYPSVLRSTLTVARRSRGIALLTGELHFAQADIKHHRTPAPGLRFDGPSLPLLIEEILGHLVADDEAA